MAKKSRKALILAAVLSVLATPFSNAQMPGATGGPSGPIDITADEQEFAGDAVIARGRVRVVYKDSVILAPLATLYKDAAGNPNRAIFTGHPRLTQGSSKIDANTLTFEMTRNKIIADGNAHSEVDVPADEEKSDTAKSGSSSTKVAAQTKPAATSSEDEDEDEELKSQASEPAVSGENPEKKPVKKTSEKIITDSDRQEYDQASGRFDALGHVRVVHGDIVVQSDKLQLVYGANNNKPETAIFTGNVTATQGKNTTCADNLNYSLSTKRLQATGHVKSKVIQEKKEGAKKSGPTASIDLFGTAAIASSNKSKSALSAEIASTSIADDSPSNDKPVWVFSDAQDYSRDSGRVSAHGNVRVVSGEMYGCGPSIVLLKKPDGRAEKIVFRGRSQISQPGRRWIADEIVYLVDEQRVIANGNAKAMILQNPASGQIDRNKKLLPDFNQSAPGSGSRLAEKTAKRSISANKVEAPK